MKHYLIALIFFCVNGGFHLTPYTNVAGKFHMHDVGNFLIWSGIIYHVIFQKSIQNLSKLNNLFTWFILFYILFVFLQVALANMFYGQSMLSGLIRVREQFYYGSFILFLLIIDTRQDANRLMNVLTVLSIIAIVLCLINYFGPTILHHKWAKNENLRSGIIRSYVPGISIILLTGLWHLTKYLIDAKATTWSLIFSIISYAVVIFAQTRGRIIAITITLVIILITQKKYKLFAGLSFLIVFFFILIGLSKYNNIISNLFTTAYQDVTQKTGTWEARLIQIREGWKILKKHPFIGSGGLVIRQTKEGKVTNEMMWANAGADLGYTSWIKYFGVPGILWMISFIGFFYWKLNKILATTGTDKLMAGFAGYMFTYIIIAEITLDSFYRPHGIIKLCLTLSFLQHAENTSDNTS